MSGGGGFGEKPKPKVPKPSSALLRWGEAKGVDYGGSLSVKEFDGIRGVAADEALVPGTRVLAVPAALALQVTTNQPAPSWADKELWRSSTWYVRLALRLLHEKGKGASSELAPWVEQLPASFDTPFFWNEEELEALAYRPLQQAVEKQRTEWAAIARKLPSAKGGPSAAELHWALSCVRSRAFSGPYSPGTIKSSASQLAFAASLALGYAGLGIGPADAAANGVLAVLAFLLANDLLFARLSREKRYVVCPVVDLCNHHSSQAGVEAAYEYFADAFAVVLPEAVRAGGEVRICYGPRSNDQLLQQYGFVEAGNPHDDFAIRQDDLVLALNAASPFAPATVQELRGAALIDPALLLRLTRGGVDPTALRVARTLLRPADARPTGGEATLPLAAEGVVLRALAVVADEQAAALGDLGAERALLAAPPPSASAATCLARALRVEKMALLEQCASTLRAQADANEAAGRVLPNDATPAAGKAPLPGFGLSRIK